ncbi:MAG: hypothetical protein AB7C96_12220 [Hydrogenovibrio sp.]
MSSNLSLILEKHKAFFAFSQDQFDRARDEGVNYVSLGSGLICPKGREDALLSEINALSEKKIKDDLAKNSRKDIIWRELANYEAHISNSIEDTVDALASYGISEAEIAEEYKPYFAHCVEHDLF